MKRASGMADVNDGGDDTADDCRSAEVPMDVEQAVVEFQAGSVGGRVTRGMAMEAEGFNLQDATVDGPE